MQVMRLNSERLALERENSRLKEQVRVYQLLMLGGIGCADADADADHVARHLGDII